MSANVPSQAAAPNEEGPASTDGSHSVKKRAKDPDTPNSDTSNCILESTSFTLTAGKLSGTLSEQAWQGPLLQRLEEGRDRGRGVHARALQAKRGGSVVLLC